MLRVIALSALLVTSVCASLPQSVSAGGTPLKGNLIIRSGVGAGKTGDCTCEWQWFTVGLNPGKLTVGVTMQYPDQPLAPTWEMRIVLVKGTSAVTSSSVTCDRGHPKCIKTARLSARIQHRGVYYLHLEGFAAHGIPFAMRVSGPIYKLHCRSTC